MILSLLVTKSWCDERLSLTFCGQSASESKIWLRIKKNLRWPVSGFYLFFIKLSDKLYHDLLKNIYSVGHENF